MRMHLDESLKEWRSIEGHCSRLSSYSSSILGASGIRLVKEGLSKGPHSLVRKFLFGLSTTTRSDDSTNPQGNGYSLSVLIGDRFH